MLIYLYITTKRKGIIMNKLNFTMLLFTMITYTIHGSENITYAYPIQDSIQVDSLAFTEVNTNQNQYTPTSNITNRYQENMLEEPCCSDKWFCNGESKEFSCCCAAVCIIPCFFPNYCSAFPEYLKHKNRQLEQNHKLEFLGMKSNYEMERIDGCIAACCTPCVCVCLPCIAADSVILMNKELRHGK